MIYKTDRNSDKLAYNSVVVLDKIDELIREYKYRKLPSSLSNEVRQFYEVNLSRDLNFNGDKQLLSTSEDTLIAHEYSKVVIGDYGAFIEIERKSIFPGNIIVKPGQEYRINNLKYVGKVKYHWLTADDSSDIKIYYQLKHVDYADYIPGRYYVSVYDIYKF